MLLFLLLATGTWAYPAQEVDQDGPSSRKILGSSVVTSVSVIMDNGAETHFSDAVGRPMSKPPANAQVASPINLLNPDRYEFYTFDDNGDLVKRLMTLGEIQGIIANGDGDAFNYNTYPATLPEKKVNDVVSNVQNVLKGEIEMHKNATYPETLDTPDVSASWSMILPAIFGNSGEQIKPSKPQGVMIPDTITVEQDANIFGSSGEQIKPSKPEGVMTPETVKVEQGDSSLGSSGEQIKPSKVEGVMTPDSTTVVQDNSAFGSSGEQIKPSKLQGVMTPDTITVEQDVIIPAPVVNKPMPFTPSQNTLDDSLGESTTEYKTSITKVPAVILTTTQNIDTPIITVSINTNNKVQEEVVKSSTKRPTFNDIESVKDNFQRVTVKNPSTFRPSSTYKAPTPISRKPVVSSTIALPSSTMIKISSTATTSMEPSTKLDSTSTTERLTTLSVTTIEQLRNDTTTPRTTINEQSGTTTTEQSRTTTTEQSGTTGQPVTTTVQQTRPATTEQRRTTTTGQPRTTTAERTRPTTTEQARTTTTEPRTTTTVQPKTTTAEGTRPTTTEQPRTTTSERIRPTTTEQRRTTTSERTRPTTTEQPRTTTTEQPRTTTTGQLRTTTVERTRPTTAEQPRPTSTEQPRTTTTGQLRTTTVERTRPTTTEQPRPTTTEQARTTTTGQLRTTTVERRRSTTTEQLGTTTTEQPRTTTTGQPRTTTTGQPRRTTTEQPRPITTQQSKPTTTEQIRTTSVKEAKTTTTTDQTRMTSTAEQPRTTTAIPVAATTTSVPRTTVTLVPRTTTSTSPSPRTTLSTTTTSARTTAVPVASPSTTFTKYEASPSQYIQIFDSAPTTPNINRYEEIKLEEPVHKVELQSVDLKAPSNSLAAPEFTSTVFIFDYKTNTKIPITTKEQLTTLLDILPNESTTELLKGSSTNNYLQQFTDKFTTYNNYIGSTTNVQSQTESVSSKVKASASAESISQSTKTPTTALLDNPTEGASAAQTTKSEESSTTQLFADSNEKVSTIDISTENVPESLPLIQDTSSEFIKIAGTTEKLLDSTTLQKLSDSTEKLNTEETKYSQSTERLPESTELDLISVPEILDQLLLTSTNIYEINTELGNRVTGAFQQTTENLFAENGEVTKHSETVPTTEKLEATTDMSTTERNLVNSIEQLLQQAIDDSNEEETSNDEISNEPNGAATPKDEISNEPNGAGTSNDEMSTEANGAGTLNGEISTEPNEEEASNDEISNEPNGAGTSNDEISTEPNGAGTLNDEISNEPNGAGTLNDEISDEANEAATSNDENSNEPNEGVTTVKAMVELSTVDMDETGDFRNEERFDKTTENADLTTLEATTELPQSDLINDAVSSLLSQVVSSAQEDFTTVQDLPTTTEISDGVSENLDLKMTEIPDFKTTELPEVKLETQTETIKPTESSTVIPKTSEDEITTRNDSSFTPSQPTTLLDTSTEIKKLHDGVKSEETELLNTEATSYVKKDFTTQAVEDTPSEKPEEISADIVANTSAIKQVPTTERIVEKTIVPIEDSDEHTTVLIITRATTNNYEGVKNISTTQPPVLKPVVKKEDSNWSLVPTIVPHQNTTSIHNDAKPQIQIQPAKPVVLNPQTGFGLDDSNNHLDPDIYQFVNLCNELAFGFWNSVTNGISTARSVFVSPFAATSLLAMVFLGARGATSGEMNEILKLDDMITFNPHLIFRNVTDSIETSNKSGVATSIILRELYSDKSKGLLLSFYKERAKQFYDGHVEEVSFKEVGDVVRKRTNLIVKRLSKGKIPEYIKDSSITVKSPLAGVSVSIFQTDCTAASTEGRDGELYFIVLPSIRQRRLIPVPAAVWRSGFFAGYEPGLDATAVSIGANDQTISTIFVIPGQQGIAAPGDGLARLERHLVSSSFKEASWSRLLRSLIPRPGLEVQIPRFAHKSIINATVALQHMGMKDLFDSAKADLRGLNGVANDLYLSDILQINSFATCGEDTISTTHHSEIYPATANRTYRRSRKFKDVLQPEDAYYDSELLEEPRDYQRAFHDPLHDPKLFSLPLPLRPRQARLPDAPRLRFDRPFLYFVRHNPTGLILHMGRFNPRLLP